VWYRGRTVRLVGSLAACVALAAVLWFYAGGSNASRAFAAAIDSIQNARTFSCKQISWHKTTPSDTYEYTIMFKEPGLERLEEFGPRGLQIIVTDYTNRRQMTVQPGKKEASIADMTSTFTVNERTGDLAQTRLDTGTREDLLRLRAKAVRERGMVDLEGRPARLLQSVSDKRTIRAWVNPHTNQLLQIEVENENVFCVYKSIQIDVPLDDKLFRIEPPAGYTLFKGGVYQPWTDHIGKVYAKMRSLIVPCIHYAEKHGGQWPVDLSQLQSERMTPEVLARILAAPEQPNGPAVIRYRQPRGINSVEVVLYEVYETWPAGGIAVGFSDGHCMVVSKQDKFEKLLR
jgi:outer membrane lipoprotein-sorting protein